MNYLKHGDKVKCLFGKFHDRVEGKFIWDTEEHKETEIRITRDFAKSGQLIIGLGDFNLNYPDDVYQETEEDVTFQLFDFAFSVLKGGKEFEVEQPDVDALSTIMGGKSKVVDNVDTGDKTVKTELSPDTHLMDLIKILKTLSVKKIIFDDGNEIEIN